MKEKKFYRTRIAYEVLSEEPIAWNDLEDVAYECKHGEWSGRLVDEVREEITVGELIAACEEHGTDPEFFGVGVDEDEA